MSPTAVLFSLAVVVCTLQLASGDTFRLKTGGSVVGKLLNANESPRRTYRIRLESGGDVTLDVGEVSKVEKVSPNLLRYRELLEKMPSDTAKMHWIMVEQASKLGLPKERDLHLNRIISLEPNHEEARKALGFKKNKEGEWYRTADLQAAKGKVRRKGRWVTQEEADLLDAQEKTKEAKLAWQRKLRMWKKWLSKPGQQSKAVEEISSIEDPLADEALVKMFWSERNIALRELIADVLGRLNSGRAVSALAKAAMQGSSQAENDLRIYSVRQLKKNNRRSVVPGFVGHLRSPNNTLVRRAGYALGELGDDAVTLPLIKALRTKHTQLVGGQGNGGINARNGGVSVGRTKPKKVDRYLKNKEVLNALIKIVGKDHGGYDQERWLNWYLARSTPPNLDLRRDP